jgi:AcrR family transcriptional regulator
VLEAARELFTEHGYVATTIGAIAARAGVSLETVYAAFGNKRSLLAGLLDVAIVGDDAPVPILERTAPVYEVLRVLTSGHRCAEAGT